jgi:hypothetical protein
MLVSGLCICSRHGNCMLNIVDGADQAPRNLGQLDRATTFGLGTRRLCRQLPTRNLEPQCVTTTKWELGR